MVQLIAKQHLLPSIQWLMEQAAEGGRFSRIDLLVKDYSAIEAVTPLLRPSVTVRQNLDECLSGAGDVDLVLLDEGGGLHRELPAGIAARAVGVEQTTSGLQRSWKCPMVHVCRSAAKLLFESQIIARGIVRKLDSLKLLHGHTVGIIGLGALGSALARVLIARGVPIAGTEIRSAPADLGDIAVGLPELLQRCDVLLGCSGVDVLDGVDLTGMGGRRVFVSCSSGGVEFRSVLKNLSVPERFGNAQGWIGRLHCSVPNGSYPINFDRAREWELFEEIVLTRKLVLEGLAQAQSLMGEAPKGAMLEPAAQLRLVSEWLESVPDREAIRIPGPLTEAFFRTHSEGEVLVHDKPAYAPHSTTPQALARMRSHTHPYDVDVMGLPILVLPGVWSPAYDWSSSFYVENIPQVEGLEFLEIGCGTGVISVFVGRSGARRVVAADINPEAVRNTQLNFERFGIENGVTVLSDGFANVSRCFDVVTWNAPYHGSRPADMLERGCADEDYRAIRAFFRQVAGYLKRDGVIVFGFSKSGDLPLIESLIAEHGFRIRRKLSDWREGYNCMLFELVRASPERSL